VNGTDRKIKEWNTLKNWIVIVSSGNGIRTGQRGRKGDKV
jgi:hypothetical protein